ISFNLQILPYIQNKNRDKLSYARPLNLHGLFYTLIHQQFHLFHNQETSKKGFVVEPCLLFLI
ncbi:hypothetical protein, partial [Amedibacillus dolichus]|uniref:hypothetical protein n=1 Tax=Amedibacillus dolichus TaxID=31971 RepID=UPI002431C1D5